MLINHTLACLWVFMSKFEPDNNWVKTKIGDDYEDYPASSLYLMSFYFVTTTVTTVGYGDISAVSGMERFFSVIMLFIGVLCFASLSGSLASYIT